MTHKTISFFINKRYSKPHKKDYNTNKTEVYCIDDIWSLDILDLKGWGPENNGDYRYVLVVTDTFIKLDGQFFSKNFSKSKKLFRKNFREHKEATELD